LHDIKWIAKSIQQLKHTCEQDTKPHNDEDDGDDKVKKYIQATVMNLIPNDDDNNNAPAPNDQEDKAEEANVNNDNDINDKDGVQSTAVAPSLAVLKLFTQYVNFLHFISVNSFLIVLSLAPLAQLLRPTLCFCLVGQLWWSQHVLFCCGRCYSALFGREVHSNVLGP